MSVSQILGANGQILPQYLPPSALTGTVQNPLTDTLQAYNPSQLVRHDITGCGILEASTVQTENFALVPGSLQTAIRSAESIELATAKRLAFQDAGDIAVGAGQSLSLGGTLVAPDVAAAGAPWANVLGFDPITGVVEYQAAAGGGGVTNPLSADLDCGGFNLTNGGNITLQAAKTVSSAGDITVQAAAGAVVKVEAATGGSLTINGGSSGASLKPDTGFCEVALNATAASLVSGNKNVKITMDGASKTALIQTSALRSVAINEAAQTVTLQANGGTTAMALNGSLGGSAAIAANGTASIAMSGGEVDITADSDLKLIGTGLTQITAGVGAGLFLRIWVNGTPFKVQLLNDV